MGRLIHESEPSDAVLPETLLRVMQGSARGFLGQGEEWVAFAGEIARVVVEDGSRSRFETVRSAAQRLHPSSEEEQLRFFGGFSFLDGHSADGIWTEFPSALFVVPEVELHQGPEGTRITARARLGGDEPEERRRESLLGYIRALKERLLAVAAEFRSEEPILQRAVRLESDRAAWYAAVEEALAAIGQGKLLKVVLARALELAAPHPVDPIRVLFHLRRGNSGARVFLFEPTCGSVLLGAAPETLAACAHGVFHATAVAGSAPAGSTPEETESLARSLLESQKDRREHSYAVDDIVERLRPLAEQLLIDPEPSVLALPGIQHLESRIRARVRPGAHILDLLDALHPTPAVCGYPREAALEFLMRREVSRRGWYAGPVGWFDAHGNGMFLPALRSAISSGGRWRLFAGAGIVPGSEPSLEWRETTMKLGTVLKALSESGAR